MADDETSGRAAVDRESSFMDRTMMGAAEHGHSFGVVLPTFGSQVEVVNVEKPMIGATRHDTALVVTSHHMPAGRRRNGLSRAPPR